MNAQRVQTERARQPGAGVDTRLRGGPLVVARMVWATLFITPLLLFVLSVPARYGELTEISRRASAQLDPGNDLLQLFLSHGVYASGVLSLEIFFVFALTLTSTAMVWRNSTNWRPMFFSAVFVAYSVWVTQTLDALVLPSVLQTVANLTQAAGLFLAIMFFLLFPNGCFVPGWTRLSAFCWAVYCLAWGLFPDAWFSLVDPFEASLVAFLALMLLGWGLGLVAQAIRYRSAGPRQRSQTKWVMLVIAGACVGYASVYLPSVFLPASGLSRLLYDLFGVPVFWLFALPIPVALAVAMQRYHLFDVRFILRSTLVYALLTGALAAVYIGIVVLLQAVFLALTGQRSQVAVVVSTLAIAVLFRPLRRRLQATIDRRFYRKKYDAQRILEAYSIRLRNETDLDALRVELLSVVVETMQPAHASLGLRPVERQEESASEKEEDTKKILVSRKTRVS